jgi:hypothetical protein
MELDPSFNSVAQTQSGLPHLLDLLRQEYRRYITDHGGQEADAARTLRSAEPFLAFCEEYLRENRPVQSFPIDMNYGLLLSNNVRCAVSPGVEELKGTMQESFTVPVNQGMSSQQGQEGVAHGHVHRVS